MTKPSEPTSQPSKDRSRGWSDDMRGAAILKRLQVVDQLYSAWLVLKNARPYDERVGQERRPRQPNSPNKVSGQ